MYEWGRLHFMGFFYAFLIPAEGVSLAATHHEKKIVFLDDCQKISNIQELSYNVNLLHMRSLFNLLVFFFLTLGDIKNYLKRVIKRVFVGDQFCNCGRGING